jgi:DUF1365 family protein
MQFSKAYILKSKIIHKRFFPKVNEFTYASYHIGLPIFDLDDVKEINIDHFGPVSFYNKDHGPRNGESLQLWIKEILKEHGFKDIIKTVSLLTLPRVLAYVFNPASFWLCFDATERLRFVLVEVNNTFGETHSYLCFHDDKREILSQDILAAKKVFHVSPFLEREGEYAFRFSLSQTKIGIWIDYFDADHRKKLVTSLTGDIVSFEKHNLRKVFWSFPLVTIKTIALIHWQALKLFLKGVKYVPKPKQKKQRVTLAKNKENMKQREL